MLHPYLGLRARYSLVWVSQVIIPLAIVAMGLFAAIASIDGAVDSSKAQLAASCLSAEKSASVLASMPYYSATAANKLTAQSATAMVQGVAYMIDISIRAVTAILVFVIDVYRSLFLCLADLVVRSGLTLAINATEALSAAVEAAATGIADSIQSSVDGINTALQDAFDTVNRIPGVDIDVPTIPIPDLAGLSGISLPDSVTSSLSDLNSSMPTLDEMKERLGAVISIPFDQLRQEVSSSMANATLDPSTLPVPARQTVAFCADLDTSFVDSVGDGLRKTLKIALILLGVALFLIIAISCLAERIRYKAILEGIEKSKEIAFNQPLPEKDSAHNRHLAPTTSTFMAFLAYQQQPLAFSLWQKVLDRTPKFRSSPTLRTKAFWFMSYITHPPALILLLSGLIALIVVQLQFAALNLAREQGVATAREGLANVQQSVMNQLNIAIGNSSAMYANDTNARLAEFEMEVNQNVFGYINTSTTILNTTINQFYEELTTQITNIFGSTPLEGLVLGVSQCIIGSKIEAASTALTWLNEHASITLPRLAADVLQLSPDDTEEFASSMQSVDSTDQPAADSLVDKLFNQYEKLLRQQRWMAIILLLLYAVVVFCAIIGVCFSRVEENPTYGAYDKPDQSLRSRFLGLCKWRKSSVDPRPPSRTGQTLSAIDFPLTAFPSPPLRLQSKREDPFYHPDDEKKRNVYS